MKSAEIKFRVTEQEKQDWKVLADREGLTISEFIRLMFKERQDAVYTNKTDEQQVPKKCVHKPEPKAKEIKPVCTQNDTSSGFERLKRFGKTKVYY
jgi:hypothetical protein